MSLLDRMGRKSNPSQFWNSCKCLIQTRGAPGGLELPTFWFVATQYKTLSAAAGVAYRGTRHLSRS
jgi:hypothetical protein